MNPQVLSVSAQQSSSLNWPARLKMKGMVSKPVLSTNPTRHRKSSSLAEMFYNLSDRYK